MWPFKKKPPVIQEVLPDNIKPEEETINLILNDRYCEYVPYQWVNWASDYLGEDKKYHCDMITIKSFWVLYEACRIYKERSEH